MSHTVEHDATHVTTSRHAGTAGGQVQGRPWLMGIFHLRYNLTSARHLLRRGFVAQERSSLGASEGLHVSNSRLLLPSSYHVAWIWILR